MLFQHLTASLVATMLASVVYLTSVNADNATITAVHPAKNITVNVAKIVAANTTLKPPLNNSSSNVTSSIANVTSSISNVTPSISNVTPSISNVTPSDSNVTSSDSNVTSSISNVTSSISIATPSILPNISELNHEDTTTIGTNSSETTTTGTNISETTTTGTNISETTTTGTNSSEMSTTGTNISETTTTGTNSSETTGTNSSETTASRTNISETTTSGTNSSETTTTGTNISETTTTGTNSSEMSTTGTNSSETTASRTNISETTTTGTNSSETTGTNSSETTGTNISEMTAMTLDHTTTLNREETSTTQTTQLYSPAEPTFVSKNDTLLSGTNNVTTTEHSYDVETSSLNGENDDNQTEAANTTRWDDNENSTIDASTDDDARNDTDAYNSTSEEPEIATEITTLATTTTTPVPTTTTTIPPLPDCPIDLLVKLKTQSDSRKIKLKWSWHYNTSIFAISHPHFEFNVYQNKHQISDPLAMNESHVNYQDVEKNLTAGVTYRFCIGVRLRLHGQSRDCQLDEKKACEKASLEVKEEPSHGTGLTIAFVILVIMVLIAVVAIKSKKRVMNYYYGRVRNRSASAMKLDILPSSAKPTRVQYNRPITIAQFDFHFRLMSADSKLKFSVEFEELNADSPIYPYTAALIPENQVKNRWTNILPFDHSRAKLLPIADDMSSDYINANYIPGYTSQREYIATQGPLPSTVDDFWRMIWEQGTSVIVMLTQCVERGKLKCEEYWPTDQKLHYYGDLAICLKSESVLPEYSIRIFDIQLGSRITEVKQIHFTMWPDFGCPENTQILLDFVKSVRMHVPYYPKGPIVVHCSAGVGRTGTFIAVERLMKHVHDYEEVDVFNLVREMRKYRNFMVQTEDQYVYIHECVRDYLKSLNEAPSEISATESQLFLNKSDL